MIEAVLQFLALLLLAQSAGALGAVLRFARYSSRRRSPHNRYQPKAVVIVPCRGLEPGLEDNIRALCAQDYREYELVFVTESDSDPAHALLSRVIKQCRRPAWMIVAGEASEQGQKIHNLQAAIDMLNSLDRRAEVLVFADSDARPARNWLADLVAPLDERRVGATTGFRWYLPERGGLWSLLLSVWNASALGLLGERSSFAWGGATAIRRENFDRLRIRDSWTGALSDDYVLTRAVQEAGQRIKFVPTCLVATHADADFRDLVEFTTRQIRITRVYAPRIFKLALATNLLYNITLWGGLAWVAVSGRFPQVLAALLALVLAMGAAGSWMRVGVAARVLHDHHAEILRKRWAYACLGPLASLLYCVNLVASAGSRRIVWRGIGYELISPSETRIWSRPKPADAPDAKSPARKRKTAEDAETGNSRFERKER
ncbi:MAG: glycosyltransferase family 2 protein [Acidobacteria bacterium]|nr:glycosyltransferase family 2 protein [Acidobacteriota bacterium]